MTEPGSSGETVQTNVPCGPLPVSHGWLQGTACARGPSAGELQPVMKLLKTWVLIPATALVLGVAAPCSKRHMVQEPVARHTTMRVGIPG